MNTSTTTRSNKWLLLLALLGLLLLTQPTLAQKDDKEGDEDFEEDEDGMMGMNTTMEELNQIACPDLGFDASCEDCLEAGCVISVRDCLASCDVIADAACWDMQYHQNHTVVEVCGMIQQSEADQAICGEPSLQTCEECTSILKSDATPCAWYEMGGYCGSGPGCDMMGDCPAASCDGNTTIIAEDEGEFEPPMPMDMDDTGGEPCNGFDVCEPCLNSRMDCSWIAGTCQRDCSVIADAACYGYASFPNMTGPEICAMVVPDTPEDTGDTHPCNGFDLCEPCLNSRIECSWIAGTCQPDCTMIADAACYNPAVFENMTGPEICAIADSEDPTVATDGGLPPMDENTTITTSTSDGSNEPTVTTLDEGDTAVSRTDGAEEGTTAGATSSAAATTLGVVSMVVAMAFYSVL